MLRTSLVPATVFICALLAAPAHALSNHTFVSALGNDGNACSITAPCRTLQAAFNATAVNGEIDILDPTGYGAINITHAVTIEGHGLATITQSNSGASAITISANSFETINIRGVYLDGVGSGQSGINFIRGGILHVQDSTIRNFATHGINFVPNQSAELYISHTRLYDNNNNGIQISGVFTAVLDHVVSERNGGHGVGAQITGTVNTLDISDSVLAGNGGDGLFPLSTGSGQASVTVTNSVVAGNAAGGIFTNITNNAGHASLTVLVRHCTISNTAIGSGLSAGNGAVIWVTGSSIFGNEAGLSGNVISYGDNTLTNNTTPGSFANTLARQ